jgi:hypothetical protein
MADAKDKASIRRTAAQIKKLQESGATEGERAAAAGKLSSFLIKHNMSMAEVWDDDERDNRLKSGLIDLGGDEDWREFLAVTVAEGCLCRAVRRTHNSPTLFFVGLPHNIIVAKHIFEWLRDDIVQEARIKWDDVPKYQAFSSSVRYWSERERDFHESFTFGVVTGLQTAFARAREATRREAEKKSPGTWGLVPIIEKEVDDFLKTMYPDMSQEESRKEIWDTEAYYEGIQFGKSRNVKQRQIYSGVAAEPELASSL